MISSFYLLGGVLISEISCCRICMELKTCRLCGFKVDPLKILSGVCQHPKSLLYTKTAILTASTRQQMQVAVERWCLKGKDVSLKTDMSLFIANFGGKIYRRKTMFDTIKLLQCLLFERCTRIPTCSGYQASLFILYKRYASVCWKDLTQEYLFLFYFRLGIS